MRIILSGGGTAGHINPAIAIAEIIRRNDPQSEILFIGAKGGMEERLIPESGYRFLPIKVSGLRRSFSLSNLRAAFYYLTSPRAAGKLIDAFSPDLVVGTGGYVCYPVVHAAAKRGIPTAVHESNAIPGLSVRMLSREADKILIAFSSAAKYLRHPERSVLVGNPVRPDFYGLSRKEARERIGLSPSDFYILSFGGSLGAAKINAAVISAMGALAGSDAEVHVLHASGAANEEIAARLYTDLFPTSHPRFRVQGYIKDMPLHMRAADLVISRAGAMTVSELSVSGCPSILIPYPHAAADHQTANAEELVRCGAAAMIPDADLTPSRLLAEIRRIRSDPNERESMSRAAAAFTQGNAAERILAELSSLVHSNQ